MSFKSQYIASTNLPTQSKGHILYHILCMYFGLSKINQFQLNAIVMTLLVKIKVKTINFIFSISVLLHLLTILKKKKFQQGSWLILCRAELTHLVSSLMCCLFETFKWDLNEMCYLELLDLLKLSETFWNLKLFKTFQTENQMSSRFK